MKNHTVLRAKFHIGIMAGGRVYSSVDAKQGFEIEMWPMGLHVRGTGVHAGVSHVVSYNNVIGFDVREEKEAAPPAVTSKGLKSAK